MIQLTQPTGPLANTRMVQYLWEHLYESDLFPPEDIAEALGCNRGLVTRILNGWARIPFKDLVKFADATDIDPVHLLELGRGGYWPPQFDSVANLLDNIVTDNEMVMIRTIRETLGAFGVEIPQQTLRNIEKAACEIVKREVPPFGCGGW